MGNHDFEFSESETTYRNSTRKQWYYKKDIKENQVIEEGSLIMLREDDSQYNSLDLKDIVGKRVKTNVYANDKVQFDQVDNDSVAAIIVRTASNRLPGKALLEVGSTTCIKHLIRRVQLAKKVSKIIVCTTNEESDDYLVSHLSDMDVHISRGDSMNIVSRVINGVAEIGKCKNVIRITGDDIMVDPEYIDKIIDDHNESQVDYTSSKKLPSGTETEIFKLITLKRLEDSCADLQGTEYLTYYIERNKPHFSTRTLDVPDEHNKEYRLTIDTKEDYEIVRRFIETMEKEMKEFSYTMDDINDYFETGKFNMAFKMNREIANKQVNVDTSILWRNIIE